VRSGNYRPLFRKFFYLLLLDVLVLGYCGGSPGRAHTCMNIHRQIWLYLDVS